MASPALSSPPRPRAVVQIGVTGHRPNRLPASVVPALQRQSQQVLQAIAVLAAAASDAFPGPPLLRILSPLAEGADRIVARAGLAAGADLQCLLPFPAGEYCCDFESAESRDEFHALLARASAVFEADGARGADEIAYERIGQMLVAQSDFLIAIWDGQPAAGRGGTAHIVDQALAQAVPVLWLHASEPRDACILLADEFGNRTSEPLAKLAELFSSERAGPAKKRDSFDLNQAYFAEKQPGFDGGRLFTLFRDLLGKGQIRWKSLRLPRFQESAGREWASTLATAPALPERTQRYLLERLCPHYAWADGLSSYYGGLLRSGSLAANLLSAFAVFFALAGPLGDSLGFRLNRAPSLIEFALIATVLFVTYYGRRSRWHERWLNYRQLAERLRQYFYLAPLGCTLPAPRYLPHFGPDPNRSWVDSMVNAMIRDSGLAPATVNESYLDAVCRLIDRILADQIAFHNNNRSSMAKLNHRLHRAGTALFAVTLLACMVHVVKGGEAAWLLVLGAAPPAFGAAFYSISNQGEFARSGDRSLAMARHLESIRNNDLPAALAAPQERFTKLREVAEKIAEVMISETIDWNVVFRYRPLNLPG